MTTMELMRPKSHPTAGYNQSNVSDDNPHAYQPGALNPYHVGYDQPTDPGMQPPPAQQQAIQIQPTGTTINIQQQPVVTVNNRKGRNLIIPSILVAICCCCLTGILATIYARKAQSKYSRGQWEDAEVYQTRSRNLMVASVFLYISYWCFFLLISVWTK